MKWRNQFSVPFRQSVTPSIKSPFHLPFAIPLGFRVGDATKCARVKTRKNTFHTYIIYHTTSSRIENRTANRGAQEKREKYRRTGRLGDETRLLPVRGRPRAFTANSRFRFTFFSLEEAPRRRRFHRHAHEFGHGRVPGRGGSHVSHNYYLDSRGAKSNLSPGDGTGQTSDAFSSRVAAVLRASGAALAKPRLIGWTLRAAESRRKPPRHLAPYWSISNS